MAGWESMSLIADLQQLRELLTMAQPLAGGPAAEAQPVHVEEEVAGVGEALGGAVGEAQPDLFEQEIVGGDGEALGGGIAEAQGATCGSGDAQLGEDMHQPLAVPARVRTCWEEMQIMKSLQPWTAFWNSVCHHCINPRQALAHNCSTACQPKKEQGPAGNLIISGIEAPLPASGGGVYLHMSIPHSFSHGDGLEIEYDSPEFSSLSHAQKDTCLELLCFMLVSGPTKMHMHPNQWTNGFTSIEEVRQFAYEVRGQYLMRDLQPVFDGSVSLTNRIGQDLMPRPRPASNKPLVNFPQIVMPPPGLGHQGNVDENKVFEVMGRLGVGQKYPDNGLPVYVWPLLRQCLPDKGLLPFLQRYPACFEVTFSGQTNRHGAPRYSFCVLSTDPKATATPKEIPKAASSAQSSSASSAPQPAASGAAPQPAASGAAFGAQSPSALSAGAESSAPPPPPVPPAQKVIPVKAAPPPPVKPPKQPIAIPGAASGAQLEYPKGPLKSWKVAEVVAYLHWLELGHVTQFVIAEAIDGAMLKELAEEDLISIGFTKFQARKIKGRLY